MDLALQHDGAVGSFSSSLGVSILVVMDLALQRRLTC